MKQTVFLIVAAIVPGLFGAVMMVAPDLMLANSLAAGYEPATRHVTQWVGFGVFALGSINFLARNDTGSPALRAILLGNILFHALGLAFDTYHYLIGFMSAAGLLSGLAPHAGLALGFLYFLRQQRRPGGLVARSSAAGR